MSVSFKVPEANLESADWEMQAEHVCKTGSCGNRLSMKWRPERAEEYAEVLTENTDMQAHFEQAMADRNHEVACDCLRSMIVQAAGDYRVDMACQVALV
jgi:hypothetical protein